MAYAHVEREWAEEPNECLNVSQHAEAETVGSDYSRNRTAGSDKRNVFAPTEIAVS